MTDQDWMLPPEPTEKERRRMTATHEAGHAVVAYHLAGDVGEVTIVPDDETRGHVTHGWWYDAGERPYATQAERVAAVDQQVRDDMAITLAGRAAVELLIGRAQAGDGFDGDDRAVWEDAHLLGGYHPEFAPSVGAIIGEEWARALALVEESRAAIEAVAEELLRVGTIDGYRLHEIIERRPYGPSLLAS